MSSTYLENAPIGVSTKLDVFKSGVFETGINRINDVYILPTTPISNVTNTIIEFRQSHSMNWYDLASIQLLLKFKVVGSLGETITDTDKVMLANMPLTSVFSNAELFLNDEPVGNGTSGLFPYKSFLSMWLDNTIYYKKGKGKLSGYFWERDPQNLLYDDKISGETIPKIERVIPQNNGLRRLRQLLTDAQYNEVAFMGPLKLDGCMINHYLIPHVNIRVKLTKHSNDFSLITLNPGYKIEITYAELHLEQIEVVQSVTIAMENRLRDESVKYAFKHRLIRQYQIPMNSSNFYTENIFNNDKPDKLMVIMVESNNFNGAHNMNPFYFPHHNIQEWQCSLNGRPVDSKPKDFHPIHNYMEAFNHFYQHIETMLIQDSCVVLKDEFLNKFVMVYDLTSARRGNADGLDLNRKENVKLNLQFRIPLPYTVNLLIMGIFNKVFEINSNREVIQNT